MTEPKFSSRILRRFAETAALELGADQFKAILALSQLPAEWQKPGSLGKMNAVEAARVYASLQAAMREKGGLRGIL